MKTRKISRKNLDELAEVMPVLTEQEMSEYIGRTHFCDMQGKHIDDIGTSPTLRFIEPTDLQNYKSVYCPYGSDIANLPLNVNPDNWGTSFSNLEDDRKKNIIQKRLNYSGAIEFSGKGNTYMEFDLEKKLFRLNPANFENYYIFESTLVHESVHRESISMGSGNWSLNNSIGNERLAYLAQANDKNLLLTPIEYRKKTACSWFSYFNNESTERQKYAKEVIASKCNVPLSDIK